MKDIEKLLLNSINYNTSDSPLTAIAQEIVGVCRCALDEEDHKITQLENNIAAAKKAAEAEVAEMDATDHMDVSCALPLQLI